MHRSALAVALVASLLAASRAGAVTQPDGTVIPQGSNVQNMFASRGEPLNAQADAAITPERFVPGCVLTFTLVTRDRALFQNAFGWYNVTGSRPDESDLHVLIPCNAPTGFVATLDLRSEPAYRGGEIGFFLRTPQDPAGGSSCTGGDCCGRAGHPGYTYFTERTYNPDNRGPDSYIHLLMYDSRVTPRAFYFAWEDLYGGGDNQFTDFVALVSNIVCSGAGAACDTGRPGICAAGTQQCRSGRLECVGAIEPRPEVCDGLDNDCDGTTDEGDELCPVNQVCERGTCVERCLEQSCFADEVCTPRGTCVEAACATVECPEGQRCEAGRCVGVCDGVRCPGAQVCRAGRCVDPCAGVACDDGQVCVAGVCQQPCQCRRCAAGEVCGDDGRCGQAACMGVRCGPGTTCVEGACRDDCEGAVCPRGERCEAGACVPAPPPPADGGVVPPRDGSIGGREDAAALDAPSGRDAGTFPMRRDGCGCRAAGANGGRDDAAALAAGALAGLVAARRRRRPRAGGR